MGEGMKYRIVQLNNGRYQVQYANVYPEVVGFWFLEGTFKYLYFAKRRLNKILNKQKIREAKQLSLETKKIIEEFEV
jgi:hypothetical protein